MVKVLCPADDEWVINIKNHLCYFHSHINGRKVQRLLRLLDAKCFTVQSTHTYVSLRWSNLGHKVTNISIFTCTLGWKPILSEMKNQCNFHFEKEHKNLTFLFVNNSCISDQCAIPDLLPHEAWTVQLSQATAYLKSVKSICYRNLLGEKPASLLECGSKEFRLVPCQ